VKLRPYQIEALDSVRRLHAEGQRYPLMVLPTGTGKTITALHLVREYLDRGQRVLWVAHRQELIDQPIQTATSVWGDMESRIGVVKARRDEHDRQLVFASMDTIKNPDRLAPIISEGSPDLVVMDEAHHSASDSWQRVLMMLDVYGRCGNVFLGLTATPDRADGKALGKTWVTASNYPLQAAVDDGWLVPWQTEEHTLTGLSDILEGVPRWGGDFETRKLSDAIIEAKIVEHTGKMMARYCHSEKAIVFTVTVRQAELTVDELRAHGFKAEVVHGNLSPTERGRILGALRSGSLDCVANCAVLTEGYDDPSIGAIVLARPTRSKPLYIQMVGRGLRPHPGKDHLLLLDLVGASSQHDLSQAPTLLEQERPHWPSSGHGEQRPKRTYSGLVGDRFRARCSWVEIAGLSPPVWVADAGWEGLVALVMAPSDYRDHRDTPMWVPWLVRKKRGERPSQDDIEKMASRPMTLEMATGVGTDFVRKSGNAIIAQDGAEWRSKEMTATQKKAMASWRLEPESGMTRGMAADMLTKRIAAVDLVKVGLCDEVW